MDRERDYTHPAISAYRGSVFVPFTSVRHDCCRRASAPRLGTNARARTSRVASSGASKYLIQGDSVHSMVPNEYLEHLECGLSDDFTDCWLRKISR